MTLPPATGIDKITEFRWLRHGEPMPAGWEPARQADMHHHRHAILIMRPLPALPVPPAGAEPAPPPMRVVVTGGMVGAYEAGERHSTAMGWIDVIWRAPLWVRVADALWWLLLGLICAALPALGMLMAVAAYKSMRGAA